MFSAQIAISMRLFAGIFASCRNFCNQITQYVTVRIDRDNKIGNFRIACIVILVANAAMFVSFSARGLTSRVFFFHPTTKIVPVVWADGSFQCFFGCFVFVRVKVFSAHCAFVVCFHTAINAGCGFFFNKRAKRMNAGCGDSQVRFVCFFFAFVKELFAIRAIIMRFHTVIDTSCGGFFIMRQIMAYGNGNGYVGACQIVFVFRVSYLVFASRKPCNRS